MYLIFVDECGYSFRWKEEIENQPFYILAAVTIKTDNLQVVYETIRYNLRKLDLPNIRPDYLGKGSEIKAKDIDRGEEFWRENPEKREEVRAIYLSQLSELFQATVFVIIVDKKRHYEKYKNIAEDPEKLALCFLLERIQGFLTEKNSFAIILIDANKKIETQQKEQIKRLLREGSSGAYFNIFRWDWFEWQLKFNRILEIHFADSKYSLGIQIADFVARHIYSWVKHGKDPNYPGWQYIEGALYKRGGKSTGWGYKEFP